MPTTQTRAIRTLVTGLVDYAGLFPPARLPVQPVVENYARYRAGEQEWMLGRLICPVTGLMDLSELGAPLMPGTFATSGYREYARSVEPWAVSAIIDADLEECLEIIEAFNDKHSAEDRGLARIDSIELKVRDAIDIDRAMGFVPDDILPHFELPVSQDVRGMVAALAGQGAAAKIRCGGTASEAFPAAEQVADFIIACAQAEVPFKATAGLHHPIRGEYRLTYELDSAQGTMFGFLNVFLAAALVSRSDLSRERAVELLGERDIGAFRFTDESASWRDHEIDLVRLAKVRETFALSYGSCSFEEPIDDLKRLGLL